MMSHFKNLLLERITLKTNYESNHFSPIKSKPETIFITSFCKVSLVFYLLHEVRFNTTNLMFWLNYINLLKLKQVMGGIQF